MDEQLAKLSAQAALRIGPESSCKGKVKHASYAPAHKAAQEVFERTGREMNEYPCPFCYHWHIGRKMTREEIEAHVNNRRR